MMPFQTKIAATYALLMVLVVATMPTTMALQPCSDFNEKESACVKRQDWCIWQGQDNTCVPAATEEQCATKEKRILCRKLRCAWDRRDKKCLLDRSTREAKIPEVSDLETTPRPDRDGEPDRNVVFDTMPVSDRDGETDKYGETTMPVPDRDGEPDRDVDFDTISKFLEFLKEMKVEDAIQEIENHYGDTYRVYVCPKVNPDVQCLTRNFDDHRIKLGVNRENVVKNPTVG